LAGVGKWSILGFQVFKLKTIKKAGIMACLLALVLMSGWIGGQAQAAEEVVVSVFTRETCRHCQAEKEFLHNLQQELPAMQVKYYDLAELDNENLFKEITDFYGITKGTPLTLVRGQLISGFDKPETTGALLRDAIKGDGVAALGFEQIKNGGAKVGGLGTDSVVCDEIEGCSIDNPLLVTIPIIGNTVDVGKFSLVGLSLVLGLIDGFNPCAMWVLVMFLLLLVQIGDRRKMWQFAGLFVLAQAIMYYLILMVWFAVWDFVALDRIVTPLIGWLALGSGVYFLYKFKTFKPVCSVTSFEQQQKVETRATALVSKPMTMAVALGVIGLALSVNIFEFACSVGIPQAFTKILELNSLGWLKTQGLVIAYMLMYMLDDIIVFGLALWSFEKIGLTHKYSKWTTLIGGILMILLGLTMLLKPEWLVV